ncbi:MAG: MFS family permease [Oleiphilaceae bacterium]|jgi:MFS family permease
MIASERRAIFSLGLLYASRMLGLFMVLPVFVIYGQDLGQANEVLIGLAIGAYGLSQAIFQIPFGSLSDKYGRKKLIYIGLVIFFLGSVLAASSESIYGVILGRFLQGAGAIASVLMALLSDLTSFENRTKAMAMIGMSIGVSFTAALIIGPLVAGSYGLEGIFWLTAMLALAGMCCLYFLVPTPLTLTKDRNTRIFKDQIIEVLKNPELVKLDIGIFALHLCLTAVFIAVPITLQQKLHMPGEEHWLVYLTVMVFSFFAMVPFIIYGEKKQQMKRTFLFAVSLLMLSGFSFIYTQSSFSYFWCSLFFYFMAFNLLEASLPSLVSKLAPAASKGTAMGVYSTAQFLGAFFGGVLGGLLLSRYHVEGVYILVSVVCLIWLLIARFMINPTNETGMTLLFSKMVESNKVDISNALNRITGVEEVVLIIDDQIAYLKVHKSELDQQQLDDVMACYR